MHHARATLHAPPQAVDFGALPGVRDLVVNGCEISCNAPESALDGLVKALAGYPVRDLTCTEAELEEAFLGFYTDGGDDAD